MNIKIKTNSNTFINVYIIILLSILGCQNSQYSKIETSSPDKEVKVLFKILDGIPTYSIFFKSDQIVEASVLGFESYIKFEGGFKVISTSTRKFDNWWKPIYGENKKIHDNYNSMEIGLEELGERHRLINVAFRIYNEGIAFRYIIPKQKDTTIWKIKKELSTFKFVKGSKAFPIYQTEQTYSNLPIDIEKVNSGAFLPLTIKLSKGFASILEANVDNYPNMLLNNDVEKGLNSRLYGEAEFSLPFSTPWRVITLASDEGKLIENESIILNLNPPCAIKNSSWIVTGKTISNDGSILLKTNELKKVVDFASENGFRYLQLDWGWYGTEVKWSDEQIKSFSHIIPEKFKNSGWESNTRANPFKVGKGYFPYGWDERWKNSYTYVDLDIQELIEYAKRKNVGICLYVEASRTLRSIDIDSLFGVYESWGLAGLKPGFVKYGTQENTQWIRNMVELAAKHHLLLCIHDARIPDGTTRTFPNLIINEGGGGQEGNHPVVQDVMLPFTRCLAGPFDYTPFIYTKGKSNAHMLSFFVVYYGPAQTMRGGYVAWHGKGNFGKGGEELEFLKRVPATWDETKVLNAKIGHQIIVARKNSSSWFVGGMTGANSYSQDISLDFLDPGKTYKVTLFSDCEKGFTDGWCPTKKRILKVNSSCKLPVSMIASGGFVAIFDLE